MIDTYLSHKGWGLYECSSKNRFRFVCCSHVNEIYAVVKLLLDGLVSEGAASLCVLQTG